VDNLVLNSNIDSILVIAAHPDDEILGCGASMARLAAGGVKVHVVYVATGVAGRYENPVENTQKIAEQVFELKKDVAQACDVIGVRSHSFLDFPDNRLDTVPLMDISHKLKKNIQKLRPCAVLTHHHGDYNWDHSRVFEATLMACRPNFGDYYPQELYSYEVLSSTERAPAEPHRAFLPNVYVDASEGLDAKLKAIQCYQTELNPYPHPRSVKAVKNLAGVRGNEVGLEFAEAFRLIRNIVS